MRAIKFRGKRITDGRWVYGGIATSPQKDSATIHTYDDDGYYARGYFVDPATIGQFTGLTDKNGTPIYEGDIIGCDRPHIRHLIFYCEKEARFKAALNGETEMSILGICGLDDRKWNATKEVIGNIHDNPDLIEKGGQDDSKN